MQGTTRRRDYQPALGVLHGLVVGVTQPGKREYNAAESLMGA
jgi:hypothetical protein